MTVVLLTIVSLAILISWPCASSKGRSALLTCAALVWMTAIIIQFTEAAPL